MLMNQSVINRPELPKNSDLMANNGKKRVLSPHISLKRCDIRGEECQNVVKELKNNQAIYKKCDSQENLFIRYFIKGQSPKSAAKSAGYSNSTSVQASVWLNSNAAANRKLHVFYNTYLQLLELDNRALHSAADTLAKRKIDAHFVEVKILEQLDKANADIPAHYKTTKDKETGEDIKTPIYKYNQPAALKALELLGKHKAIKAFDNEIEHKSTDLTNLLSSLKTNFRPPQLTASQSHQVIDVTPSTIIKRKAGRPRKSDTPPKQQVKKQRGRPKKARA